MIRMNDTKYQDYLIEVTWKNFSVSNKNAKKRFGEAPCITFQLNQNTLIGLEFTFSKTMFLNTKINIKTNVKEYISDIIYATDKGWKSLILENYDGYITRVSEKTFHLDFYVLESEIHIFIDENVDIL